MIKFRVPATSANLGPGFDSLGLALNLYNNFKIKKREDKKVIIKLVDKNKNKEIRIPNKDNLIFKAYKNYFDYLGNEIKGIEIVEEMNTPLARGLGSSSSAIIGGLGAAAFRLNTLIPEQEFIQLAVDLEKHPDNVVPALVGGLCINFYCNHAYDYYKIDIDKNLDFIVTVPDYELKTEDLRNVLPKKLNYSQVIDNMRSVSLLTAAFINHDYKILKIAMEDQIHQPFRKNLIKSFDKIIQKAYQNGAYGAALSGAGPTILAISSPDNSENIAKAMERESNLVSKNAKSYILKASNSSLYQSLDEEIS